ncbi:hypothetical protein PANT_5c00069 [Moesziomyces antarcticus T-34]|uniref:RED-like N-terminal domain-containing protein n=1 Tax=Pseudozyma antarctica (strain T-34) TaxID=1151754 RepID=M9LT90_PSEA3|nr:hypothetical protein PANT_5c00069 [Moesziomyces antarcticus T-34]
MDQDAFRQLVSSASSSSGSTSQRSFGKTAKRAAPSSSTKPADLSRPKPPRSGSAYVDRAAARRSGTLAREFSDVEALQRDFEARIAAATSEEERKVLRDQLSSVGGDARYSVLVKGLDYALLAQNKAKLDQDADANGQDADLEQAFHAEKPKRSRDEIMNAIKKRRAGATGDDKNAAGAGMSSGFRPIGKANEDEAAAEYKWKNGKRMRKKVRPATQPASIPDQIATSEPKASVAPKAAPAAAASPPREEALGLPQRAAAATPPQRSSPSPPAASAEEKRRTSEKVHEESSDDDGDDDIFADVGGWTGIADVDETPDPVQSEEPALNDTVPLEATVSKPFEPAETTAKASAAETPLPARGFSPAAAADPQPQRQPKPLPPASPQHEAEPKQEQSPNQEEPQPDAPPPSTARPRSKWDALDEAPRKKKRKSKA